MQSQKSGYLCETWVVNQVSAKSFHGDLVLVLGRPRRVHIAGATELRGVFLSLRNPPAEVEMSNRREYVSQLLHSSRVVHDYLRLRLVRRMVMIRMPL